MSSPSDPHNLLSEVLSGPLTPALSDKLDAWLREDPQHPVLLAQFMLLEDMIGAARKEASAESILKLLLEMEEKAEPQYVTIDAGPTLRDKAEGFLLDRHVRLFALAACILFAVSGAFWVLSTILATTDPPSTPKVADQVPTDQTTPSPTRTSASTVVATLTAEHNAVWVTPPSRELYAGDRLTLMQGFAELTTNRGAVAILEAPATIEFINNNALHLHTGKLVGICETDSSKGFLVRTEHMNITDLGTRFGVDAFSKATEIHVLQGEVAVAISGQTANSNPINLIAGESAGAVAGRDTIELIEHQEARYADLLPRRTLIAGTGHELMLGQDDSAWQLTEIDRVPLQQAQALSVDDEGVWLRAIANDPAVSQWLAVPMPLATRSQKIEPTYSIQTTIDLPALTERDKSRLVIRYMADNALQSVTVNGQRLLLPRFQPEVKFVEFDEAVITEHLVTGQNTLVFELVNNHVSAPGNPVGLRLEAYLEQPAWAEPLQ